MQIFMLISARYQSPYTYSFAGFTRCICHYRAVICKVCTIERYHPMLCIFGKLSSSQCYANLTRIATYYFQDIPSQNLGCWGNLGVPPKWRRPVWDPYLPSCKISCWLVPTRYPHKKYTKSNLISDKMHTSICEINTLFI